MRLFKITPSFNQNRLLRLSIPIHNMETFYPTGKLVRDPLTGLSYRAKVGNIGFPIPGSGNNSDVDQDVLLEARTHWAKHADITGGYGGEKYVVTTPSATMEYGTYLYGITGEGLDHPDSPRWITFTPGETFNIDLNASNSQIVHRANKTVDGRGADVNIVGGQGLQFQGIINSNQTIPYSPDKENGWQLRFPDGVINTIYAYVNRSFSSLRTNFDKHDLFSLDHGFDKFWVHHVGGMHGGGDALLDFTNVWDSRLVGGSGLGRVHIDWSDLGPHPDAFAWNYAVANGLVGSDNSPDNGKCVLGGLDPQDGAYPDNLLGSFVYNRMWGFRQRAIKIQRSRWILVNNLIGKWSPPPGVAAGSSLCTDVGADGEALIIEPIYEPYTAGEMHVLGGATVDVPDTLAVKARHTNGKPDPYVKVVGGLWLNGATYEEMDPEKVFQGYSRGSRVSPYGAVTEFYEADKDWNGTVPYAFDYETATMELRSKIQARVGNVQVWEAA